MIDRVRTAMTTNRKSKQRTHDERAVDSQGSLPCRVNAMFLNLLSQVGHLLDVSSLSQRGPITVNIRFSDALSVGVGSKRIAPSRTQQVVSFIADASNGVKTELGFTNTSHTFCPNGRMPGLGQALSSLHEMGFSSQKGKPDNLVSEADQKKASRK